ncbi:Inner membrane protein YjcH [compost metagenome]
MQKRSRFAWLLSGITLVLYVAFILLIAFDPQWLGTPLYEGATITRGIPVGVGLIVISFVLTGIYVVRANGEFDRLTADIIREVQP